MSKQRPILFSTPMVQAILEGRKTQTRRTKGLEKVNANKNFIPDANKGLFWFSDVTTYWSGDIEYLLAKCPYGQVGDLLWVRETWYLAAPFGPEEYYFGYKVSDVTYKKASSKYDYHSPDKWKPSIHMPKEAARIWLRITRVGVERLQKITEESSIREGVEFVGYTPQEMGDARTFRYKDYLNPIENSWRSPYNSFASLWQSINGEKSWDSNPWVWVIEFERCDAPALEGGAK